MYGIFWVKNVSFMFLEIYGTMYITFIEFILMNENICRPECITSGRIGSVEQKAAGKCIHEYNLKYYFA